MRKTKTTASNGRCRLLIPSGVILAMAVFVVLSFFTQPSRAQTPSCPLGLQADELDLCPGTSPGTIVNPSGCPIVTNVPRSAQQSKNDGWRRLVRWNGSSFKTQGDCIQFVNTGS